MMYFMPAPMRAFSCPPQGSLPVHDDDTNTLLARIDERLKHLEKMVAYFVTQIEFAPVKMIAFGLAGLALASVLGALLAKALR
jgi:hypothetical protein